jgi:hypothetical protein
MSVNLSQAGIRVELDVNRLGDQIAKRVAEHLAHLFPQDATDFWVALCEQAHRERQRVAAIVDLTCPQKGRCPYRPDIPATQRQGAHQRNPSDPNDLPDSDTAHEVDAPPVIDTPENPKVQ